MYQPPHFEETQPEAVRGLISGRPLGTLVTVGADGINANHIPFLYEPQTGERGALIGHVARNNVVWRDHNPDVDSLIIFQGPSAYISPNWYQSKQETHEVVPTYNYAVVHVYGKLIIHDDPKWVRGIVGKLTKAMEAAQPKPWRMAEAPAAFIASQIENIVGIEIAIVRVFGKWKVSQNRPLADRQGAIQGLRTRGESEEEAMAQLIEDIVPK